MDMKFVGSSITGYGYAGSTISNDSWLTMTQLASFDDTGTGRLGFKVDGSSVFTLAGTALEDVQQEIVSSTKVNTVSFSASFNTYRQYGAGAAEQTFSYRNIVIGWNLLTK